MLGKGAYMGVWQGQSQQARQRFGMFQSVVSRIENESAWRQKMNAYENLSLAGMRQS